MTIEVEGLLPRSLPPALAVMAMGRILLYSTDWSNQSSLAVARKLKFIRIRSRLEYLRLIFGRV